FKLTVAYDGRPYVGWQVQPNGLSVQAALENAIEKLVGYHANVLGSGRTDAGVHAIGQVASVKLPTWDDPGERLAAALNTKLPDTIRVWHSCRVADGFHPIRDCIEKRYRYRVALGRVLDPRLLGRAWHIPYRMNIDSMREAAEAFVGKGDFAAMQAAHSDRLTTVRDVRGCTLNLQAADPINRIVDIEIWADGFLYNMVRNIVGMIIEVGRGYRDLAWIEEVLGGLDRRKAAMTAPAEGLYLVSALYEGSRHES
ncbi:MAG: tRNA pseudouridine(38-40) synthase TruA, partial [Planctomycetota bacterium]